MKLQHSLLASGVALAIAGGAQAGPLSSNEIFIGGATAPQNFLRLDIIGRICDPAHPITNYVDEIENTGGAAAVIGGEMLEHGDHFVVHCTARGTFGNDLDGQDVAIYKFNGGSSTGVAPVANATTVPFLNASPANCTSGPHAIPAVAPWRPAYTLYECPTAPIVQTTPDAGVSDVEPDVFVGSLARNFGPEPRGVSDKDTDPFIDQGNLVVVPGPGLMFGTIVTLDFYDALLDYQNDWRHPKGHKMTWMKLCPDDTASLTRAERDSVLCMPSLGTPDIRAVFTGKVTSWADFHPYGQTLDPVSGPYSVPEGNNVHVCTRHPGSGTHAQHAIHYLGTNCTSTADTKMAAQNDGLSYAPISSAGFYSNKGSSDMDDCMRALGDGTGFDGDFDGLPPESFADTGDSTVVPGTGLPAIAIPGDPLGRLYNHERKAYAMGYNSLEKNTSLNLPYRFVKLGGVPPKLYFAQYGDYEQTYYLSFQHRVAGGSADPVIGGIRTALPSIAVLDGYFDVYNSIDPVAVEKINESFEVDPDGVPGNGDEWGGGFLTTQPGGGALPATPNTRQDGAGNADSCQTQEPI